MTEIYIEVICLALMFSNTTASLYLHNWVLAGLCAFITMIVWHCFKQALRKAVSR